MDTETPANTRVTLSRAIGDEIRVLLTRARRRQSHLARAAGVTEHWLSMRLRGEIAMSVDDLARIVGHLSSTDRQIVIAFISHALSTPVDAECLTKLPEKDSNLQPFGSPHTRRTAIVDSYDRSEPAPTPTNAAGGERIRRIHPRVMSGAQKAGG